MKQVSLYASILIFTLSACEREATGQVAAVVDGDEITLQEVNAEIGNRPIPDGADRLAVQKAALQQLVDRRLMAEAARDEKLDESPDYLIRQKQLDDALLVQLLTQKMERSIQAPTPREIDKFIAAHPQMFDERMIYNLDRIQFIAPSDPQRLKLLEDDHSMSEVMDSLRLLKIDFQRGATEMDSMQIDPDRLKRILSLPPGEPFVVGENGLVYVAVVTGSRSQPVTGDQARPIALAAMQREAMANLVNERLADERKKAKISYQDGFAPAAAKSSVLSASDSDKP